MVLGTRAQIEQARMTLLARGGRGIWGWGAGSRPGQGRAEHWRAGLQGFCPRAQRGREGAPSGGLPGSQQVKGRQTRRRGLLPATESSRLQRQSLDSLGRPEVSPSTLQAQTQMLFRQEPLGPTSRLPTFCPWAPTNAGAGRPRSASLPQTLCILPGSSSSLTTLHRLLPLQRTPPLVTCPLSLHMPCPLLFPEADLSLWVSDGSEDPLVLVPMSGGQDPTPGCLPPSPRPASLVPLRGPAHLSVSTTA